MPSVAKILGPVVLLSAGTFLTVDDAEAVAGFVRQTGMTCNHCHTLHGAPTPNFTFTGRKFKALGYRLPGMPGHTQDRVHEQGEPEDRGEFINLLPTTWSARMQYSTSVSKPPGADDWGDVITNPTSRLALFPFIGPIGKHFGVWTEFYVVPFTSQGSEWGISDTSYEEFDFRYVLNPGNKDYTIALALANQGVYELFGFGPFPGLPSEVGRGGVGGYTHPNRFQAYVYGWMNDRWVWTLGADSGDTNYSWGRTNLIGLFGYAFKNRNDNELWLNVAFRTGSDALPLVTNNGVNRTLRNWQYMDGVDGITATRGLDCLATIRPGNRPLNSCAYIAEEVDSHTSVDLEMRWGGQNIDRFFGERQPGPWSFELVGRVTTNDEDYFDGAGTKRDTWGIQPVIGWRHTWYLKPLLSGDFKYEFTDFLGTTYDIDTKPSWNFTVAYKPVENFLIYLSYANTQNHSLTENAVTGKSIQITADLSF